MFEFIGHTSNAEDVYICTRDQYQKISRALYGTDLCQNETSEVKAELSFIEEVQKESLPIIKEEKIESFCFSFNDGETRVAISFPLKK